MFVVNNLTILQEPIKTNAFIFIEKSETGYYMAKW